MKIYLKLITICLILFSFNNKLTKSYDIVANFCDDICKSLNLCSIGYCSIYACSSTSLCQEYCLKCSGSIFCFKKGIQCKYINGTDITDNNNNSSSIINNSISIYFLKILLIIFKILNSYTYFTFML